MAVLGCALPVELPSLATVFADMFGLACITPTLLAFLDEVPGIDAVFWFGFIVTAQFLALLPASILWGYVSDRIGPRNTLMIIALGDVCAFTGTALSGGPHRQYLVLAARLAAGGFAPQVPAIAFLFERLPRERAVKGMSRYTLAVTSAATMGFIVVGVLYRQLGWRGVHLLSALFPALSLLLLKLTPPKATAVRSADQSLSLCGGEMAAHDAPTKLTEHSFSRGLGGMSGAGGVGGAGGMGGMGGVGGVGGAALAPTSTSSVAATTEASSPRLIEAVGEVGEDGCHSPTPPLAVACDATCSTTPAGGRDGSGPDESSNSPGTSMLSRTTEGRSSSPGTTMPLRKARNNSVDLSTRPALRCKGSNALALGVDTASSSAEVDDESKLRRQSFDYIERGPRRHSFSHGTVMGVLQQSELASRLHNHSKSSQVNRRGHWCGRSSSSSSSTRRRGGGTMLSPKPGVAVSAPLAVRRRGLRAALRSNDFKLHAATAFVCGWHMNMTTNVFSILWTELFELSPQTIGTARLGLAEPKGIDRTHGYRLDSRSALMSPR